MIKRVCWVNVEDNKGRRRPQRRWRDEVKDLLLERELMVVIGALGVGWYID